MILKQARPVRLLGICVVLVALPGCSTLFVKNKTATADAASTSATATTGSDDVLITTSEQVNEGKSTTELTYHDQKIPNTSFDLPVEMNPAVAKWISYFTGKGRDRVTDFADRDR